MIKATIIFLILIIAACSGPAKNIHLVNMDFGSQDMMIKNSNFEISRTTPSAHSEVTDSISMPNGTLLGRASSKQAMTIAAIAEQSHNITMWRLADLKKTINTNKDDIKESIGAVHKEVKRIVSNVDGSIVKLTKEHEAIESRISMLEQDIKNIKQGVSSVSNIINETKARPKEITLFFIKGSSKIDKEEKQKLIGFMNSLESRAFHVTCRANASPEGSRAFNLKLGKRRCDSIERILRRYFSGQIRFDSKAEVAEGVKREDYEWTRNVKLTFEPVAEELLFDKTYKADSEYVSEQIKRLSEKKRLLTVNKDSKKQPQELAPLY